jgi:hypothetical protein
MMQLGMTLEKEEQYINNKQEEVLIITYDTYFPFNMSLYTG